MTELVFGRNDHCKTPTAARLQQIAKHEAEQEAAAAEWRRDFKAMLSRVYRARGKDGEAVCQMLVAIAAEDIPLTEMERIRIDLAG